MLHALASAGSKLLLPGRAVSPKDLRLARWLTAAVMVVLLLASFWGVPAFVHAADPSGAETRCFPVACAEGDPSNAGLNIAWTLVTGFLVFFMQLGFAFLGAGLIRSRNTVNYMTKSFMDFCIASLGFWSFGFALMFGGSGFFPGLEDGNKAFGWSGFFLTGDSYDVSTIAYWFFQMVFAATAATIVAGAVAERMKITAYLAYSFVIGALIYPIYGHWIWGNGWLATWQIGSAVGARDFAGSGVVHTVGGLTALVGAAMVGPRIGKFTNGKPNVLKGHNLPYVVIGTFILFFGWFGFNPGSTLAATDLRISVIAVNTFLAAATGAVVALYWGLVKTGKADIVLACNGALAGLVGITAPCAFVAPWAAVVIGAVAAPVMILSARFVERVLKVDDAVGAVAVHAGAGIWGLLAVGIFADGTYLGVSGLVEGELAQMALQLGDIAVVSAWTLTTAFATFWVINKTIGLRASREEELSGLDMPEHGIEAYPADVPAVAGAAK